MFKHPFDLRLMFFQCFQFCFNLICNVYVMCWNEIDAAQRIHKIDWNKLIISCEINRFMCQ